VVKVMIDKMDRRRHLDKYGGKKRDGIKRMAVADELAAASSHDFTQYARTNSRGKSG